MHNLLFTLKPFNQHNREEPGRYAPIHSCTYLVELFPPPSHRHHHHHHHEKEEGGAGGEGMGEEEEAAILRNQRWVDDRLHELGESRCVVGWDDWGGRAVRIDYISPPLYST